LTEPRRETLVVRDWRADDFDAVVALWHRTARATYTFLPGESSRTLDEAREYFRARIEPSNRLFVAELAGEPAGFLALRGGYVDRLYVDPVTQRRGVGRALMARAFALSPEGLERHTHVENRGARAFYEKLGFVAVAFGTSPPPECAPDVKYRWDPPRR
jgi:ribosomal protein S18 acetylase RimI-like enzyme